jgi:hypothetical protein
LGDSPQNGAVILHSSGGNYGSTVYDKIAGGQPDYVKAGICDGCFVVKVKDGTLKAYMQPSTPKPPPYQVQWDPDRYDNDLRDPSIDWSKIDDDSGV